jgi:transcriptional regulator GlxA family with amidase domain
MKFTLAVAAALASLASAEKLNLRKGTAPKGPKVKETFDAQVKIAGLVHEPTEMEMAVVDAAVVETYNEAYESVGHKLTKANSKSAMLVGEEDGADSVALLAGQVYFTDNSGYYCRWCKCGFTRLDS